MKPIALIKLAVRVEQDVVTARQKTRKLSELMGFDSQDQVRISTAVSELARNVYQYAGRGYIEYSFLNEEVQGLSVKVSDEGPGIPHLNDVLNGEYKSPTGMGVGLLGSKKLMDDFTILSEPGTGTEITIKKFLPPKNRRISTDQVQAYLGELAHLGAANTYEEIQNQNRDLINALDEVRAAKEELAELNRELSETNRGVVALYAELDEKALSLQKANELKTSFLSNMTHEFRTPLSSVISLSWLLLNRVDGDLTSEQHKQVEYIRKSAETLLELVNDLLDIAKVEAGKVSVNVTDFYVEEILGGLRGVFRPLLGNSPVEFDVHIPEFQFNLSSDEGKVSQILRNLVSNAIKFTQNGSVKVSSQLRGVDWVEFSVADTGIGIKPEDIAYVFEDFSQVETPLHKHQKGTGLGLPLSRKLAQLLGGDIMVESTVGKGSVFKLIIPRIYDGAREKILFESAVLPVTEEPAVSDELESGEQFKVLLIDDDESSRYVLKNLLKNELDAVYWEAASGKVGLDVIDKWKPDLVFLDLSMPEIDGFEILLKIRKERKDLELPVVVNSAKKLGDLDRKFISEYATAYVSKERVDEAAAIRSLRAALQAAGIDYRARN